MIISDRAAGGSRNSLEFFRRNRLDLVKFCEALLFFDECDGPASDVWTPGKEILGAPLRVQELLTTQMCLRDERGDQLWLEGVSCGYGGQGPGTAQEILQLAGFQESLSPYVITSAIRVLVLDSSKMAPVVAEPTAFKDASDIARRQYVIDGHPTLLLWSRVGIGTVDSAFAWDELAGIVKRWCPDPSVAKVFHGPEGRLPPIETDSSREDFPGGDFLIVDRSGRCVWVALPSRGSAPHELTDLVSSWGLHLQTPKKRRKRLLGTVPRDIGDVSIYRRDSGI